MIYVFTIVFGCMKTLYVSNIYHTLVLNLMYVMVDLYLHVMVASNGACRRESRPASAHLNLHSPELLSD